MHDHPGPAQPVIVTLPSEIDITNADRVGDQLSATLASGVTVIIADLTLTTFCDSAGLRRLMQAHEKAAAAGSQLRIATGPGGMVTRVLELLDLEHRFHVYPSVEAALTTEVTALE